MSESKHADSSSRWIPLECNPEVFNSWSKKAGLLTSQARFEDIYGLDEELLSLVPPTVKAIVLLFPLTGELKTKREEENAKIKAEGQIPVDPTVLWIKQTIGNACGTMALIHALANSGVAFAPNSSLTKFIDQCLEKTPEERAHLLETTPLFANIHAETADSGQTSASAADMNTDLHFTVFVTAPEAEFREIAATDPGHSATMPDAGLEKTTGKRVIELDGGRVGPIDRGECKDLLRDVASYVKKEYIAASSSVKFSMLALVSSDPSA